MKIVADENIPLVKHYFSNCGQLLLKPGRLISTADLYDADILLVRSITKVNQALLEGTAVKFVGSATTGFDHLDIRWLSQQGIPWSVATGCNTQAVVEYVLCAIASLQKKNYLAQKKLRAGVVGIGRIGEKVATQLERLGMEVLRCDPLRADITSTSLDAFTQLDFISLHTPLTQDGPHPTYHLIGKEFLQRQKKECILLNTGRGEVIFFEELKQHAQELIWCLDVWENEPEIDGEVLQRALITTPHIAGYSVQSKYRGIDMIYHAALKQKLIPEKSPHEFDYPEHVISFNHQAADWRDVLLAIFDPEAETQRMKKALQTDPHIFDSLRKNFIERHEFQFVTVRDVKLRKDDQELLELLEIKLE